MFDSFSIDRKKNKVHIHLHTNSYILFHNSCRILLCSYAGPTTIARKYTNKCTKEGMSKHSSLVRSGCITYILFLLYNVFIHSYSPMYSSVLGNVVKCGLLLGKKQLSAGNSRSDRNLKHPLSNANLERPYTLRCSRTNSHLFLRRC